MRKLIKVLIIGLLLLGGPAIVSADFNVTPVNVSTNYIKWEWLSQPNMTGIAIDGRQVTNYDPYANTYILSNLNPEEIHQITVYTSGGIGTNQTTTSPEASGDVPLGIWIYGIPAILVLAVARWARIAVLNVLCVIFGLFGLYNLLVVKPVMDSGMWTLSLIVYFLLIFIGMIAWAYQTGKMK
jgi:hypothetical protein